MEATVRYLKLSYLLRIGILVAAAACGLRGSAARGAIAAPVSPMTAAASGITAARSADCAALGPYQVGMLGRYQPVRPGTLATATWPDQGSRIGVPYGWYGQLVISSYSGCGQGATRGTMLVRRGFSGPPIAQPEHGTVRPLVPCAGPCARASYGIVGISGTFTESSLSQATPASVRLNVAITTTVPMTRPATGPGTPCTPSGGCIGTRTVTRTVSLAGLAGQINVQPEERSVTLSFTLPAMAGSGAPTTIVLYGSRGGAPIVQ